MAKKSNSLTYFTCNKFNNSTLHRILLIQILYPSFYNS
ncbi:hypothetical protein FEDK69T_00500 [Flavobacterium enshiense DK69]|nr:hypothetical protein FEDK69T_00500 [Flavobacterium enshiense DK69]